MRQRPSVLLAFVLLWPCGCNPQAPKPTPAPSAKPSTTPLPLAPHYTGHGTKNQPVRFISITSANRVEYEIIASAFDSKGPQARMHMVFQNAQVTFHGRDGSILRATAPQAIADQTANTVTFLNGVHARSSSGMTLQCMQLVYDRVTQMFDGTGNVVVTDPKGIRVTGSSFTSDISLTHAQVK